MFLPDAEKKAEKSFLLLMRKSLTKRDRLKHSADIGRVFSSRTRVSCLGAKLMYRINNTKRNRFTVTLVRKYGNAVQRNRAKRVARESYRLIKPEIRQGYDMVLLLYRSEDTLSNRSRQLSDLLHKAQLLGKRHPLLPSTNDQ